MLNNLKKSHSNSRNISGDKRETDIQFRCKSRPTHERCKRWLKPSTKNNRLL